MKVLAKKKDIHIEVYVVRDSKTLAYYHLEDCVALFRKKKSAETFIKEQELFSCEVVEALLDNSLKSDSELYYVALNKDNIVIEDEDTFLYVYHNLFDLIEYDREYFVLAQIHE